jgi:general nucleoside transport system permease protein
MSSAVSTTKAGGSGQTRKSGWLKRLTGLLAMPALALVTAFLIGAVIIWITSGSLATVFEAYWGLIRGAFLKQRGFSETLVAMVPYVFLALGVSVGFKAGLFNIGVEGQFYIGAISAAWVGQLTQGLPAVIHLPLAVGAGALGGALWAAIPGYLKARTGAHEVINTMMMNYIAFRLTEYLISWPLKDKLASAVQTQRVSPNAELWTLFGLRERLQNPPDALLVALVLGFSTWFLVHLWVRGRRTIEDTRQAALDADRAVGKADVSFFRRRSNSPWIAGVAVALVSYFLLPLVARVWWPFGDQYDRMHVGLFLAVMAAIFVWWLLWQTTIGFEMRTVGANPSAARYAGVRISRNIVLAMAISGALAGIAGTVEVLGVSICRCLPLFFSSGYGWDSIAIALLGKNNPFGILASAFLFGAMRNGSDLMELSSGVSKYVITIIQALVLLFVAVPAVVRWIYRMKPPARTEEEAPLTRGWGG